ncbi:MAG: hypothetical protein J3K34DRAFT_499216 [Monoraphidium minutum]|nr:MAG: hypothetical protein J3K34DRAFT_499216 [Monoraphidium minutum]
MTLDLQSELGGRRCCRSARLENERLLSEVERFRARLTSATRDYSDILEHREEQVRAAEARCGELAGQLERARAELAQTSDEVSRLKGDNSALQGRVADAASLLDDKDGLESAVKRQHAAIEKLDRELKLARGQVEAKSEAVARAEAHIEELTLKCAGSTQLRLLFNEPWLLQTSHVRLRGDVPCDREFNSLTPLAGGKQLVLIGGHSRSHESAGRDLAVLSLDALTWERPEGGRCEKALHSHTTTSIGRRLLVLFGLRGEEASSAVSMLAADTLRWAPAAAKQAATGPSADAAAAPPPALAAPPGPPPRLAHAAACGRERVFVFGGMTGDSHLLGDLWSLDLDSMTWAQHAPAGAAPAPRKGATLCATDDGRRLYLFGGHDGEQLLADVHYLDVERMAWSAVAPTRTAPEPREGHTAAILGGRYMLIAGGSGAAGAAGGAAGSPPAGAGAGAAPAGAAASAGGGGGGGGGPRRLTDAHILDLFTGPRWELLDAGTWGSSLLWLKPDACYTAVAGNRLLTLKPDLHEALHEMQITELTLPEDIERMRAEHRGVDQHAGALEILDPPPAAITPASISVSWRPPSKNAERVSGYKLMLANAAGAVREVYAGRGTAAAAGGLRPNSEYVFAVKAAYDDGSHLWSESRAFRTRVA